jgi:hypothetical protein
MSSGGFRSESLSTKAEIKIELLLLAIHKPSHYLYAVLCTGVCPELLQGTKSFFEVVT